MKNPANIYLFNSAIETLQQKWGICSNYTKKTPKWRQRRRCGVNVDHISNLFLRILLLTLRRWMFATKAQENIIIYMLYPCFDFNYLKLFPVDKQASQLFFFFFFFFQKIKLLPKEVKQNFKNEFLCKTKIQWTYICSALTRKTLRDFTEASLLLTLNIHWVAWKTMFFTHTFQEVNYAESHW